MKIVHLLLGKANPNTMNGVNKVVHSLATEQTRSGHDVEVWGLTRTPADRPQEPDYVLRLFPITRSRFLLSSSLRTSLRSLPMDGWVQLHSVFVPEFRAIAGILRSRDIAFGVTPHVGYSARGLREGRWKKLAYLPLVEMGVLSPARLIHALGTSEVDDVRRLVPKANIVVVPNGQEPVDRATSEPERTDDERPIVCYCGRLAVAQKGLDILLEGFGRYARDGGRGTLWLVGDGAGRPWLERLAASLGIGDRVRFHGAQFGADKLRLFAAADCFIHTSRWEGVPIAALEAAAAGLPLVVSRETNLANEVAAHDAGVVLEENTALHVAQALRILGDRLERGDGPALAAHAKAMISEDFSWPRLSERLVEAYRAAATAPPA
jgi:glycosyltransferase involved in cell wall biosynthesis